MTSSAWDSLSRASVAAVAWPEAARASTAEAVAATASSMNPADRMDNRLICRRDDGLFDVFVGIPYADSQTGGSLAWVTGGVLRDDPIITDIKDWDINIIVGPRRALLEEHV